MRVEKQLKIVIGDKMKKILFIIPLYPKNIISTAPYGTLSLASYINKDNRYEIKIIDLNRTSLNVADDFKPDYVGISALFDSNVSHLKRIILKVKGLYPNCMLLVGGSFATNMYSLLLKEIPEIDAICYGEGEIPLKELLEGDISSHAWITKESLKNNIIPKYDFIKDLDEIPIIDFSYIDLKDYNNRSPTFTDTSNRGKKNKIEMSIHTSRGCPFNCIFCSVGNTHGKMVRYMSVDRVKETIKHYIDNYNMNTLFIEDDNFLMKKDRVLEILKMAKEFNVRFVFPNGLAVWGIDDDVSKALHEADVDIAPLAIESCSDYVLQKIIGKPHSKKQIYKAVKSLKKFGIRVHAFVIIGFPNELAEHRKETYDMLLELEVDWVHMFIATPITGSRLYKICVEKGYLTTEDHDQYNTNNCIIKAPGVDPDKIKEESFYMDMVINYILNFNYKKGNYDTCLAYFQNIAKRYPDNPVVHYMIYKTIIEKDEYWNKMFKKFKDDDYESKN